MSETNTPAESQEIEATEGYATAKLGDRELRVKTVDNWRPSYLRALRLGDYDTWAAGALHPDDVDAFIEADATFAEINTFTAEAMNAAGEPVGKPSARPRSSTRTRKR